MTESVWFPIAVAEGFVVSATLIKCSGSMPEAISNRVDRL